MDDLPCGIKWKEMSWEVVNENVRRKVVVRDRMMMVNYQFEAGLAWPEEAHEAEQAGYIITGKAKLTLPRTGEEMLLGPGDGYFIGSNIPHSWVFLEKATVIDVFSPPRKELFKKEFAPCAAGNE